MPKQVQQQSEKHHMGMTRSLSSLLRITVKGVKSRRTNHHEGKGASWRQTLLKHLSLLDSE
jgi:hypothetical protein